MSDLSMQGNHHYDRAKSRLHNGTANEVTRAQAEATLALAFEQRTASLIALWMDPLEVSERGMYGVNYVILAEQIRERLGLDV
jgi:hypothetical protein